MNRSKSWNASLMVSGVILLTVGGALLVAPAAMHAANGVDLGGDPSLLSEVRAPGGALLALGAVVVAGVFVSRLRYAATVIAATVYGAYGLSRLLGMALDGMPAPGIVAATGLELALGAANLVLLTRMSQSMDEESASPAVPYSSKAVSSESLTPLR